jgi:phage tail-like protein
MATDAAKPLEYTAPAPVDASKPLEYTAPAPMDAAKPLEYTAKPPVDASKQLKYTHPLGVGHPSNWPTDQLNQFLSASVNYTFHVMVGIDAIGSFTAVENLTQTAEVLRLREGGRNNAEHALFGSRKRGTVTLKWGMGYRAAMYNWMESVDVGRHFRREVWIFHLTRSYIPMRIYRLTGAFPESWKGGNLAAGESLVESEELTLNFDDLTLFVVPLPDVSVLIR